MEQLTYHGALFLKMRAFNDKVNLMKGCFISLTKLFVNFVFRILTIFIFSVTCAAAKEAAFLPPVLDLLFADELIIDRFFIDDFEDDTDWQLFFDQGDNVDEGSSFAIIQNNRLRLSGFSVDFGRRATALRPLPVASDISDINIVWEIRFEFIDEYCDIEIIYAGTRINTILSPFVFNNLNSEAPKLENVTLRLTLEDGEISGQLGSLSIPNTIGSFEVLTVESSDNESPQITLGVVAFGFEEMGGAEPSPNSERCIVESISGFTLSRVNN